MKAVVLHKDSRLVLEDVPMPKLGAREALIKVKACGICGSDLRYLEGENPWAQQTLGEFHENPDNMILGHEFSGEVVEVSDARDRALVGRRVAAMVYKTCGICEYCRTNRENLCRNTKHIGHGAGWGEMDYFPGGMAEYCRIWTSHAYPIEDSVPYEYASMLDFISVALSAAKKARDVFAEDCAVVGCGPVGLVIAQIMKRMGARKVICVDVLKSQLGVARRMGADETLLAGDGDVAAQIRELSGGGVKTIFDTVGEPDTQRMGLAALCPKGVLVNLVSNAHVVNYRLMDLSGERMICSVANSPFADFRLSARMLAAGRLDVKPMLTHTLPLAQFRQGFDMLLHREDTGAVKVVLQP
jgi:threonine dehydrogenase-like Zn-dependent dehydrogenase